MKKYLKIACAILFLVLSMTVCLYADTNNSQKTVYLSSAYDGAADGSEAHPYTSLDEAIKALPNGGKIIVTDSFTVTANGETNGVPIYTEPEHDGEIIFTSVDKAKDHRSKGAGLSFPKKMAYMLSGDVKFENFTVYGVDELYITANFNNVEFADGFTAKNKKSEAKFLYAIGGYYSPAKADLPANLDSHMTIRSGDFKRLMGFSYVKGAKTYTFEGTSHISIYGGNIDKMFGGSALSHYSGSTNIKIYGGTVTEMLAGGDSTRRLDGTADIFLYGGTVGTLNINNVIGDVSLTLDGTKLTKFGISYANDTISTLAYSAKRTLRYNSVFYSAAFVESVSGFDSVEKYGVVYVSDNGKGGGLSRDDATSSYENAIKMIANGGGKIVITDTLTLGELTEPVHSQDIEVTGGKLKLNGAYTLSGNTAFSDIEIDSSSYYNANGNTLEFSSGVVCKNKTDIYVYKSSAEKNTSGRVIIRSGDFGAVYSGGGSKDSVSSVEMLGGTADTVHINSAKKIAAVTVSLDGCSVGTLTADSALSQPSKITLEIACDIGTLRMVGITAELDMLLGEAKINTAQISADKAKSGLRYDKNKTEKSVVEKLGDNFASVKEESRAYVADGGDGSGFSCLHPAPDLFSAFEYIKDGGEVVLTGDVTVSERVTLPKGEGKATLSAEQGNVLYMGADIEFGCEILIDNIELCATDNNVYLIFCGNKAEIGDGVKTDKLDGVNYYIGLISGNRRATADEVKSTSLTVRNGTWQQVWGGTSASGYYVGIDYSLYIYGGDIYGKVVCAGYGTQSGTTKTEIYGGNFYSNIYASAAAAGTQSYTGDITLTLNGGKFFGKIVVNYESSASFNGDYNVYINGGDYSHLTDIEGTEKVLGTNESNVHIGDNVDIYANIEGTFTYQNPIRKTADPRIALVNGMYYYVFTSGSTLSVYKAANVTDLAYSVGELVWKATDFEVALDGRTSNIWPSELQYFSAEEFGEEYAGWYLFFSVYKPSQTGTKDGSNRRSYVLKCTSEDLQGKWVNPVTGKEGVPEPFCSDTHSWVNTEDWTAGESTLRYNGEVYALWIGQSGRMTPDFKQTMYLSKLKNPWTVTGEILALVQPEYDWERVGYGYSASENIWYPAVIEGATPIVSDDNRLYVLYAASGYWTTAYSLGQMTFNGGNIFDISNWTKNPTPIFSKSDEVNGVGGPSLVSMPDGSGRYILYHGYIGKDTSSGRYCFMEPLTIDENGVHIGVDGHPSPLGTVFEIKLNSNPLAERISNFELFKPIADDGTSDNDPGADTAPDTQVTDVTDVGTGTMFFFVIIGAAIFTLAAVVIIILIIFFIRKGKKT